VQLTVVAADRDGKPAVDLESGDFEVFDNGRPRELSLCRYEGRIVRGAAAQPELPLFVFSNRAAPANSDQRNVTALLLDTFNTNPVDQMMVKAQTVRFLRALAPHTRVAVY
jgi:hypothetical protein